MVQLEYHSALARQTLFPPVATTLPFLQPTAGCSTSALSYVQCNPSRDHELLWAPTRKAALQRLATGVLKGFVL